MLALTKKKHKIKQDLYFTHEIGKDHKIIGTDLLKKKVDASKALKCISLGSANTLSGICIKDVKIHVQTILSIRLFITVKFITM